MGFAHSPDLSSLMIYEQNGKHFLAIKSSLTAFEGEVDYHFKKNAYKTPKEFEELVIALFRKKCLFKVNNEPISLFQPAVLLGHETMVFAELLNMPQTIHSIQVKNELFADMPNNQCELILMIKGYAQKQYILNKENFQQVKLLIKNDDWEVLESAYTAAKPSKMIWGILPIAIVFGIIIFRLEKIWA